MKNFLNYTPEKYTKSDFQKIEEGIYKTRCPYDDSDRDIFVTSLTFEMEPDCYGEEDASPMKIQNSQRAGVSLLLHNNCKTLQMQGQHPPAVPAEFPSFL